MLRVVPEREGGVAGADVTLTETATKSALTTTTNDAGRYNFPVVNPGVYDLVVTRQGFKTAKFSTQKVSIGSRALLRTPTSTCGFASFIPDGSRGVDREDHVAMVVEEGVDEL